MNKGLVILTLLALLLLTAGTAAAAEKTFTVDPVHSGVGFRIRHLFTEFPGRFNRFSGTIVVDPERPETIRVTAEVDIASVDTGNGQRDGHLQQDDYFAAGEHPTARFVSTGATAGADGRLEITGELTIRGVTRPATIRGRLTGYGAGPRGDRRAGFSGALTVDRLAFGVGSDSAQPDGRPMLGVEVTVTLDVEAVETAPAEAAEAPEAPATLESRLAEARDRSRGAMPDEVREALERAAREIAAQGNLDGLAVGDEAPDFTLPDANGRPVTLSERLAAGPVVLVFYRGGWCPFCNLQLAALQEALPALRERGAALLAVSPQEEERSLLQATERSLSFPLLTDADGAVQRAYRLLYEVPEEMREIYRERFGIDLEAYNGEGHWALPVTATYVIAPDGRIAAGLVDQDYTRRMEPADILAALDQL